MSKRRKKYKEFIKREEEKCEKKKAFLSRIGAKEASKKYKLKFGLSFKVYKCPYCSLYHLTTVHKEKGKEEETDG